MNTLRKQLTKHVLGCMSILVLVLTPFAGIPSASAAPVPVTVSKGNVALSGGFMAGNFTEPWDLTAGDMTISFTYDANGLVDDAGAHAWAELGIRDRTAGNFNPNNKGIWLATDYEWTANTFDPEITPTLDDKLILQRQGGQGEGAYNLPSTPPIPGNNHRVWWDRHPPVGPTANTGGRHNIILKFHATSATAGQAYMNINGLDQGFETDGNWNTIELTPAGMTFSGDMTRMQVFYGIYGYGATHSVAFNDIQVTGCLATYTITASVTGGHGSVSPATQTVDWNTSATIGITPDLGYHIATITDNGNPATIANPYVISNVVAGHEVEVTFAIDTFTVNASVSGGHGSVTPVAQMVNYGDSASISISPDLGYHIATITDNGNPATIANPYMISNVTDNHTVVVTFAPTVPETKETCKNDGWISVRRADGSTFKNQGDCIQYVNTGK